MLTYDADAAGTQGVFALATHAKHARDVRPEHAAAEATRRTATTATRMHPDGEHAEHREGVRDSKKAHASQDRAAERAAKPRRTVASLRRERPSSGDTWDNKRTPRSAG